MNQKVFPWYLIPNCTCATVCDICACIFINPTHSWALNEFAYARLSSERIYYFVDPISQLIYQDSNSYSTYTYKEFIWFLSVDKSRKWLHCEAMRSASEALRSALTWDAVTCVARAVVCDAADVVMTTIPMCPPNHRWHQLLLRPSSWRIDQCRRQKHS